MARPETSSSDRHGIEHSLTPAYRDPDSSPTTPQLLQLQGTRASGRDKRRRGTRRKELLPGPPAGLVFPPSCLAARCGRSEEHTSELQSLTNLVCRLLLEKK